MKPCALRSPLLALCALPMFPGMTNEDVEKVINVMQKIILQNKDN